MVGCVDNVVIWEIVCYDEVRIGVFGGIFCFVDYLVMVVLCFVGVIVKLFVKGLFVIMVEFFDFCASYFVGNLFD